MQHKTNYKNGQEIWRQKGNILTYFFKDGTLKAKGKFIDGLMEGEWIFNRENGDLWQVGNFKNGRKHGSWVRYNKTGKIEYEENFENGKLIKRGVQKQDPQKMKAYNSFAAWKKDQSPKNQKLITLLEKLIKKVAPSCTAIVKWGQGCWVQGDTPKIYIHTELDHIQFGFYAGSLLNDPQQLLVGTGKYVRYMKVRTVQDIDVEVFSYLIKQVTG